MRRGKSAKIIAGAATASQSHLQSRCNWGGHWCVANLIGSLLFLRTARARDQNKTPLARRCDISCVRAGDEGPRVLRNSFTGVSH